MHKYLCIYIEFTAIRILKFDFIYSNVLNHSFRFLYRPINMGKLDFLK